MEKPIITWVDPETGAAKTTLTYNAVSGGAVVADEESAVISVGIANNFTAGTAKAVALMNATDCELRITDTTGAPAGFAVTEGWVNALCSSDPSYDEATTTYTKLGKVGEAGAEVKLSVTAGDATAAKTIKGAINDGTVAAAKAAFNIATVKMKALVSSSTGATGGTQQFRTVLVYSYGAV